MVESVLDKVEHGRRRSAGMRAGYKSGKSSGKSRPEARNFTPIFSRNGRGSESEPNGGKTESVLGILERVAGMEV